MAYKRYRSLFSESRIKGQSKIKVQEKLRRILREKSLSSKDIDSIVGKIEAVITDVISGYGVDNTIVDELSNTVKNINSYGSSIAAQNASIGQAMDMEEKFKRGQRKLKENMYGMDMPSDLYNDDQMYATDIDGMGMDVDMDGDYDDLGNEVINADPMYVDEFGFESDDAGFYESRTGKIKRLSRKLREGEEADDFITDSEDIVSEEDDEEEKEVSEEESYDEDEMESDEVSEEDEMDMVDEDDEASEEDEEDEETEVKVKTDESFYFENEDEDEDDKVEESEDDEESEPTTKESFRTNRMRSESSSRRGIRRESRSKRPMRTSIRGSYREESEYEDGEDLIPMDNGSDYDFLDGIDGMGNASSERSMNAKYDYKKGM
jgi:hypothetical protein